MEIIFPIKLILVGLLLMIGSDLLNQTIKRMQGLVYDCPVCGETTHYFDATTKREVAKENSPCFSRKCNNFVEIGE